MSCLSNTNRPHEVVSQGEEQQQANPQRHEPSFLGRSSSTVNGDESAKKFYDTYRAVRGRDTSFDDMLPEEIECDNLENEIVELALFCSSTPIPVGYGAEFEPPGKEAGKEAEPIKIIRTEVLAQYIGNVIKLFQRTFPMHEEFRGLNVNDSSDVPDFWKNLRPQFLTACGRFQLRVGSEYGFSDTYVRPLYSSNRYTAPHASDGQIIDYVSLVDLRYVLKQLIDKARPDSLQLDGPLQHRAIIALTFMAVARGGEVKFVDTSNFMLHPYLGCTDLVWSELKNIKAKYAMPIFPNKDTYESDIYHSIGGFWCVERGLFRCSEAHKGAFTRLFPHLHKIKDENVTKKITRIIRSTLPKEVQKELVNSLSSRSLRKGSVTQLLITPGLSMGDICARSGHSTGTNIDSYADNRNPITALRAGKVLAEWSDVNAPINFPRFECLFDGGGTTPECVDAFISKLFVVSLDAFKPANILCNFLRICAASLVMHHNKLTADLPCNAITAKLRETAVLAAIHDIACPPDKVRYEYIIDHWSRVIYQDYCSRNAELVPPTANNLAIASALGQHSMMLTSLDTQMKEILRISSNRDVLFEHQRQQMSVLATELAQKNAELASKNAELATLQSQVAPAGDIRCVQPRLASEMDSSTTTLPANEAVQSPEQQPLPVPLMYGCQAKANTDTILKGETLQNLLVTLYNNNSLTGRDWGAAPLPLMYRDEKNLKYVYYSLELCAYVLTDDERQSFKMRSYQSEAELMDAAGDIQRRAFRKMYELEGTDPDEEEKANKTRGSRGKKATVLGVGHRVRDYKTKHLSGGNLRDIDAPPPKSIIKFFQKK